MSLPETKMATLETFVDSAVAVGALTGSDKDEIFSCLRADGEQSQNFLSVRQCAQRLGCHPITIKRAIRSGKLKARRLQRNLRIQEFELNNFINQEEK